MSHFIDFSCSLKSVIAVFTFQGAVSTACLRGRSTSIRPSSDWGCSAPLQRHCSLWFSRFCGKSLGSPGVSPSCGAWLCAGEPRGPPLPGPLGQASFLRTQLGRKASPAWLPLGMRAGRQPPGGGAAGEMREAPAVPLGSTGEARPRPLGRPAAGVSDAVGRSPPARSSCLGARMSGAEAGFLGSVGHGSGGWAFTRRLSVFPTRETPGPQVLSRQ